MDRQLYRRAALAAWLSVAGHGVAWAQAAPKPIPGMLMRTVPAPKAAQPDAAATQDPNDPNAAVEGFAGVSPPKLGRRLGHNLTAGNTVRLGGGDDTVPRENRLPRDPRDGYESNRSYNDEVVRRAYDNPR